jgi:hypothetical protein
MREPLRRRAPDLGVADVYIAQCGWLSQIERRRIIAAARSPAAPVWP